MRKLREACPHDDPPRKNPSVRDVTSWITRHLDRFNGDQAQQLKAVQARCPELEQIAQHIRACAELTNNRQGRHLHQRIDRVQADGLDALHSFVNGLGQDLDAAVAGLSLRYCSGAVEGHNNKIILWNQQCQAVCLCITSR